MPLLSGSDRSVVGENIRTEMNAGRPQPQAIAIAMRKAGKPKMPKVTKPKLRKLSTVPSVKLKPLV